MFFSSSIVIEDISPKVFLPALFKQLYVLTDSSISSIGVSSYVSDKAPQSSSRHGVIQLHPHRLQIPVSMFFLLIC